MFFPHNSSIYGQRAVDAALAVLDEHKRCLTEIIESEDSTPDEKYDALAWMTGILAQPD